MTIEYTVRHIGSKQGKAFVIEHHYSHGIHNGPTCYGLFDGDELIGVLAFATPCSENVRASLWGPDHKDAVIELHRLVVLDGTPTNTESFFIARALKLLKQRRPQTWGVLSFADATEGHVGTIYQATNALYLGTSGRSTFYLDKDGRLRHPRQNGNNVTLSHAAELGWRPVKREGKHRYLFLLPDGRAHRRWLLASLKPTPLPYPKRDAERLAA